MRVDRLAREAFDATRARSRLDRETLSRCEALGGKQVDTSCAHAELLPRPPQNVVVEALLPRRPDPGVAEVPPIERLPHEVGGLSTPID